MQKKNIKKLLKPLYTRLDWNFLPTLLTNAMEAFNSFNCFSLYLAHTFVCFWKIIRIYTARCSVFFAFVLNVSCVNNNTGTRRMELVERQHHARSKVRSKSSNKCCYNFSVLCMLISVSAWTILFRLSILVTWRRCWHN